MNAPMQALLRLTPFTPVKETLPPAAAILRQAIEASPYSVRSLAKALSERDDVTANADSIRRSLTKWMRGIEQPRDRWATILEDQLGLRIGALARPSFSRAVSLAGQLVRRLEAGESLPPETLLEVAEATEAAGQRALQFAGRLRREAEARR
jgi:hypothetical protein